VNHISYNVSQLDLNINILKTVLAASIFSLKSKIRYFPSSGTPFLSMRWVPELVPLEDHVKERCKRIEIVCFACEESEQFLSVLSTISSILKSSSLVVF
jgi:hypothetical protein